MLCFAGDAFYAYPMLMQLSAAIGMNNKLSSRALDITDVRGYLIDVIEDLRNAVYDYPAIARIEDKTDYRFIFAGYSWKRAEFRIWHIQYQTNIKRFSFRSVGVNPRAHDNGRTFLFIGDETRLARERLNRLLLERKQRRGELNMEPLEVLAGIIKDGVSDAIGGPPQLAKVYRHLNCMPYNVYWPKRQDGRITAFGRPLLAYEKNRHFTFDIDTLETVPPGEAFARVEQEELVEGDTQQHVEADEES